MVRGWGREAWGGAPWGSPLAPFRYRVELRDESFNILAMLENEAIGLRWDYNRIGGCGAFSFTLPRRFNDQGNLGGDFDVRIYKRTGSGTHALWFSGFIEDRSPLFSEPENISISGYGYIAQLNRVIVDKTYTSNEISIIVKDILDTFVTPNTDITYDAGDIVATSFTADSLVFKTTAMNAMKTLAELAGTREWGVGSDRKFFFKTRSTSVGFYKHRGKDVRQFSNIDSFRDIVNKLYIEGGDVAGTKFTRTVEDTSSQTKFGLREQIIQNSAIITNDVADQYGGAILVEKADLSRRGKIIIVNDKERTEDTVPLGLFVFKEEGVRYGEELYGTFLYSGDVEYQINKISYKIEQDATITKTLSLGQLRPELSEELEKLKLEIENLRAARV